MRHKINEKIEWVVEYAKGNYIDILNQEFVDAYILKFHPTYIVQPFGANSVPELGRLLSKAYHMNMLDRYIVGLHAAEKGFPKWVYVYRSKP